MRSRRGTARRSSPATSSARRAGRAHAFLLGATVTVTHTAGVFALGLVTLALSQFIVPEQLYPWLTLVSGLLVVAVGLAVLRARLRGRGAHGHDHDHDGTTTHHGHHHHHGTTTTTTTTTTRLDLGGHPRRRRRRGPAALPLGARRAALGDRAAPDRVRHGADRRVQPRARRDDHGDRARRRAGAARVRRVVAGRAGRRGPCRRSAPR